MTRQWLSSVGSVIALAAVIAGPAVGRAQGRLSNVAETPFKLATFEVQGQVRLGMVVGDKVLDLAGANQQLTQRATLPAVVMPADMRTLIEEYDRIKPRLYQIANYFNAADLQSAPFAFDVGKVSFKAPLKYPWNMLAAAANYKAHAEGMAAPAAATPSASTSPDRSGPAGGGFDATAAARVVPDRDAPIFFAKSPRSCIIDPGEPFYIVDGRQRTDYEGELVIVMGPRPAYRIPRERAHDYVFGYSIMQDISDRGSERLREVSMFGGTNWFDGKSTDRSAPFGPVIVPKEFLPNFNNLRISTKLNGETVQDARTSELIWDEAHLIGFLTSRLTLYPGDVILTGTPAGTGAERQKFLKPGDVVTVEIEGIGSLTTPFKALSEKPASSPQR